MKPKRHFLAVVAAGMLAVGMPAAALASGSPCPPEGGKKSCPPGLAKKDNGCQPPGQVRGSDCPPETPDPCTRD